MESLVHTEELCYGSVPLELAPGAKSPGAVDARSHKKDSSQTWQSYQAHKKMIILIF